MIFGSLIGAGASIFGARSAKKAADADRALRKEQMDRLAAVKFNPFSAMGPGGFGVNFNGPGGAPNFMLGSQQGLFDQLGAGAFGDTGFGRTVQSGALAGLDPNSPAFASALAAGSFGQADQLATNGFQRALQQQLFGQAGQMAGQTDFSSLRDSTLATLRAQAQPQNERAFAGLQDNLFGTGRLGTSGGALQTEAFARGLGQADLDMQLAATGVAQQQQMQNANISNLFGQFGQNLAGMEEDLMTSAFNRFGQTAGLAQDLTTGRFDMGSALFGQGLQSLGGQQSILNQLLGFGEFGANLGAQQANTNLAAAGGAANVPLGASGQDVTANFLSTLGTNLLGSGGADKIGAGIKNLFSGFGSKSPSNAMDFAA